MLNTIDKIMEIVRADTGASEVHAEMLLSLLPNSSHKVNMSQWNYRADSDSKEMVENLMENQSEIWEFEKNVTPYREELKKYLKK
jgi:hypothetical protein